MDFVVSYGPRDSCGPRESTRASSSGVSGLTRSIHIRHLFGFTAPLARLLA